MSEELTKHVVAENFEIVGMTPEVFSKEFSGQAFDYTGLQKKFKKTLS